MAVTKDWEKSILSAESWLLIAHIKLVTRRIARHGIKNSFESDSKVSNKLGAIQISFFMKSKTH